MHLLFFIHYFYTVIEFYVFLLDVDGFFPYKIKVFCNIWILNVLEMKIQFHTFR